MLSANGGNQSNEEPTDNLHSCETFNWVLEWSSLPSGQVATRLDVVGVSFVDVCTLRVYDCQGVVAADHRAVHEEWYLFFLMSLSVGVSLLYSRSFISDSEKSHIRRMKAWPYRQECRGHDPTKKNLFY